MIQIPKILTGKKHESSMQLVNEWRRYLRYKFTVAWILLYYDSYDRVDTLDTWSGETEVFWFTDESEIYGQATPFGTIILNETRLSEHSDTAVQMVVEHEKGHVNRRPLFKGLFWGAFIWGILGALLFVRAVGYSLLVPFGFSPYPALMLGGISLGLMAIVLVAVRIEEIVADFRVLAYIPPDEYLSLHDELKSPDRQSFVSGLIYTNPNTTVRVHQKIKSITFP